MKPLTDLTPNGIIEIWVRSETYTQAVIHLNHYGYAATPDSLRRRVRTILKQRAELPLGRKPTPKDYQRMKVKYLADWRDAEIL